MRIAITCLVIPLLGACSTMTPAKDRLASKDVPCLQRQVFSLGTSFKDAVALCGVSKPDLTGNGRLQQVALDAKVPFTIRPHADAYLKQRQTTQVTGHLVSYPRDDGGYYDPQAGEFRSIMQH